MPADLPAILKRELQRADEHGQVTRRLIVVLNLPEPEAGTNARPVDTVVHHFDFAAVLDDPGVLGAVAQFAVGGANA